MFEERVRQDYFEWLYSYVCRGRAHSYISYKKLFMLLHQIEFIFPLGNDVNRAKDGVDLRYRFTENYGNDMVIDILDGPCSVLEMLIALAVRCEETIMDDTRYGDRTGQWFWGMMKNLEIDYMIDEMFDKEEAESKIYKFLDREYEPDGKGGLFYIRGCRDDLRDIEIWTQLCWYLERFV